MSYTDHESLTEIMNTLRMNLPQLKEWLEAKRDAEAGTLLARRVVV